MNLTREEKLALLRLHFAPGIGKKHQRKLLEHFGSAQMALCHSWKELNLSTELEAKAHEETVLEKAEQELTWLESQEGRLISILDEAFPPLLRDIHGAPALLFSRGNFKNWEEKIPIAFVGTRRATEYGRQVVEKIIADLASYPVVIVSGFAQGLDTFAHQAALSAKIPTVGVLGTGLQYIYPKENEALFYQMLEQGTFYTEYERNAPPHPGHFPERNRIISGISQAVILVETPEKSGALITAEFALEQGREVMAVPGSIFSKLNHSCHHLIQQGAKLVGSAEDILEELGLNLSKEKKDIRDEKIEVDLDDLEKNLISKITHEPLHIDKITEISKLAASSVAGSLTSLLLKGLVSELPGKYFMRN